LTQVTLTSPRPAAFALLSTSLSRSITINGKKLTPYCWATLTSEISAAAGVAVAVTSAAAKTVISARIFPPLMSAPSSR